MDDQLGDKRALLARLSVEDLTELAIESEMLVAKAREMAQGQRD